MPDFITGDMLIGVAAGVVLTIVLGVLLPPDPLDYRDNDDHDDERRT